MYFALISTILAPLAIAAAIDERNTCKLYDDNYDNIAALPAAGQPITNYNGLLYQGWDVINHNDPATPVAAHTEPNVIFASIVTDLTTIGSVTLIPYGSILRGTGTKAFNLYSFYFGCSANTGEGAADVAQGCTIAVTGYTVNNQQVPVATFSFAPPGDGIDATPNLATLPLSFSYLQNVTFGIADGGVTGDPALVVLVVDDVVHCNYS